MNTVRGTRRAARNQLRGVVAGIASLALMLGGIITAQAEEAISDPGAAASPHTTAVEPAEAPADQAEAPDTPAIQEATPTEEPAEPAPEPEAAETSEAPAPPPATESASPPKPVAEAPSEPVKAAEPEVAAVAEVAEVAIVASALRVVGGFEIDGNFAVDTGGNLDWANVSYDLQDDGFKDGSQIKGKENETSTWEVEGASATGKADIGRVWSYSNVSGGDQYLHLALERENGTGSVAYVVELNQSPEVDGLVPVRTIGDLRLNVEQGGNGAFQLLGVERWDGTQWVAYTAPAGSVYGESNATSVAGPNGEIFEPRTFLETSFNLTALGVSSGCETGSFTQANIRTRTSQSINSEIEDWVRAPIDVPSQCAEIEILKTDEAGNALSGATFTITPNPTTGTGTLTVTDGGAADLDGAANGTIKLRTDHFGTEFTVTETVAPPGYLLPAQRSQTFTAQAFGTYELTFEDPRSWQAPAISKTVTATYTAEYLWALDKTVGGKDNLDLVIPGGESYIVDYDVAVSLLERRTSDYMLRGDITLDNPNEAPMVVTLTDRLLSGAECTIAATDADAAAAGLQVSLAPGTSVFTYTCYDADEAPAVMTGSNVAGFTYSNADYPSTQVHVDSPSTAGTITRATTTGYTYREAESINKTVTVVDDFTAPDLPPVTLGTVTAEELGTAVTATSVIPDSVTIAGTTATFDAGSATIEPDPGTCAVYTNTGIVQLDVGDDLTDDASVRVCVGADLEITKTANLTYERDYDWSVVKSGADTQLVGVNDDGSVTADVDYTVAVTLDGFTDSNVSLGGTIVVVNPNTFTPVIATVHDVTTLAGEDIECTIQGQDYDPMTDGFQIVLPASGSTTLTYRCDGLTQKESYEGHNVATVTWNGPVFGTPSSSASTGEVPIVVADPVVTDQSFEVVDSRAGVLGRVSVAASGEVSFTTVAGGSAERDGTTVTYTYTDTLTGRPGECVVTSNTVTIPDDTDSHDVSVCSPTVTKAAVATYDRAFDWTIDKEVDRTTINITDDDSATFTYTVEVGAATRPASGFSLSGTISVANPAADAELRAFVTDAVDIEGAVCTVTGGDPIVVPAGGTVTVNYTCALPAGYTLPEGDPVNTALVEWGGQGAERVSGTAAVDWTLDTETDATVKVWDDKTDPGSPVLLGTVSVNDAGVIQPGAGYTVVDGKAVFTYSLSIDGVAGECTEYTNTAWVGVEGDPPSDDQTVEVCVSLPLTISKDANLTYTRTFDWSVDKTGSGAQIVGVNPDGSVTADVSYEVTVTPEGYEDSAVQLVGEIEVTNPNAFADVVATVSDTVTVDGVASVCTVAGDENDSLAGVQVSVPADGAVTLTYTCPDVEPGDYVGTNRATVQWGTGQTGPLSGTASTADVPVVVTDAPMTIDQTITVRDDKVDGGVLGTVTVNRSGGGTAVMPAAGITARANDDGTVTFTYSDTLTGDPGGCVVVTNTATVPGDSDDHVIEVCSPTVTKTADATYDRTHLWEIEKSVDQTSVTIAEDGTATFGYTVEVSSAGYRNHSYELTGSITVVNPANVPLTVAVTDAVGIQGATCTVSGGADVVVPAGGSVTVTYACTLPGGYELPTADPVNTTTVRWGDESVSGAASVDWTLDDQIDDTVVVSDDMTNPASPVSLGQVTVDASGVIQPASGYRIVDGKAVFTYELTKQGVTGECTDYTNAATIDLEAANDVFDEVTVEVCRELALGIDKTVTGSYDETHFWSIEKSVADDSVEIIDGGSATAGYTVVLTHEGSDESNFEVEGTITLTNPNAWPKRYSVVDVFAGHDCTVSEAEGTIAAAVEGVASVKTLTYTCDVDDDFEPARSDANTASVTFDYVDLPTTVDSDAMSVDWDIVQVDNPVAVEDDFEGELTDLGTVSAGADGTLSVGEGSTGVVDGSTVTYTYERELTVEPGECVEYVNTGRVFGDGDEALDEDDATVDLCSEADLVTVKTATGSLDRTYLWGIEKSVTDNVGEVRPGQKVTFPYRVAVTPKGYVDANHELGGSITVTNPNGYKAVSAKVVDEVSDDAWSCTVAGTPADVAASSTVTLTYTCQLDDEADPALKGSNTVEVTWETRDGTTKTTSHEVGYELAVTEVNKVITVTDTLGDESTRTLGTATWNAAGTPMVWEYTVERTAPAKAGLVVLKNLALIVETRQRAEAKADYTVVLPKRPPVRPGPPKTGVSDPMEAGGSPLLIVAVLSALLSMGAVIGRCEARRS